MVFRLMASIWNQISCKDLFVASQMIPGSMAAGTEMRHRMPNSTQFEIVPLTKN